MKGLNRGQRRFTWFAAAASALFLALVLLIHSAGPPEPSRATVGALVLCGALTWISSYHRYRNSSGRRRRAWFTLSFGAVCGVLANSWWLAVTLSPLPAVLGQAADPLLLVALVFCVIGLLLFPPARRRGTDMVRIVLDGVVIGGSVLFVVSVTVFPQLLSSSDDTSLLGRFQLLFLPVMDVLIATMAALLITRSGRSSRVPLLLLGAGFALYAVADLSYAVASTQHAVPFGGPGDLGWIAGYLLFTVAAQHPSAGQETRQEAQESSPLLGTIVLFSVFFAAALVGVIASLANEISLAPWLIWLAVLLAVAGRQVALILDNDRLRRNLETLVQERTRELREISRELELLLASVGDGIYRVDRRGLITFVNTAATDLLQRNADDLIGRDAHVLFHAPQEDGKPRPADGCYITGAINDALAVSGTEDVYLRGDGKSIHVEATASPLQDEDVIRGAVVVFRDVSHRREVDRLKREFVSIVSHELRTPLTSIRGSLGLIAGGAFGELPPQAGRMVEIAVAGTDRLSRLINDILDLERIESGAWTMSITECQVDQLCAEACAALAGVSAESGVSITRGDCTGVVQADHDRVVQTLINLIGNAIKFSEPGSQVQVSASPDQDFVEFVVSDQGRGIPEEKLDAIFGRFSQVDSSDARNKDGTGLGLAISRSIVEALGGRIWVTSTLGVGSQFHFTMPNASIATEDSSVPAAAQGATP